MKVHSTSMAVHEFFRGSWRMTTKVHEDSLQFIQDRERSWHCQMAIPWQYHGNAMATRWVFTVRHDRHMAGHEEIHGGP